MRRHNLTTVIYCFCLSFIVFSFKVNAQIKSANHISLSQKEIQIEALNSIEKWNDYLRNDLDSLKIDATYIYTLGINADNMFAVNVGKRSIGSYLIRTGQQEEGIKYLKEANNYFENKRNYILQTEILNEIGNGYLFLGKPIEAEKFYIKSLKCGQKSPDPTSSFLAEVNLAQAYINLGNLEKATAILQHYKKQTLKLKKNESVSNAYALLGTVEQKKGNVELAKEFYEKSADYGFKSNSYAQIAHAYNNMAIVYFQDNKQESLNYFTKALELRLKTKNVRFISESYFNLGGYYHELRNYEKALSYYSICEKYCIENNLVKEQLDVVYSMMELDKLQANYEKALEKMEEYIDLQEKYFSELSKSKTNDIELIETFEKLETQNKSKLQEAKLLSLLDKQNYHTKLIYTVFGFCIVLLILLVVYKKKIN